jgi:UDP-glucose 4-epimerase
MTSLASAGLDGTRVLITGGLGFLGSAVARQLSRDGAHVRILDALLPQGGGSPRNLRGVATGMEVIIDDTRSRDAVDRAVRDCDIVFHFAGHAGVSALTPDWYSEIDSACLGTLNLLEAVRIHAPAARVVFASSLRVYGRGAREGVAEDAPTNPQSLFGVHKLTGEKYCSVYHSEHGVRAVVARLAWLFGPRQRLTGAANGTIANALDSALHGEDIFLPDGGASLIDVLHVSDAAAALIAVAQTASSVEGQVINVGAGSSVALRTYAEAIVSILGSGALRAQPHTDVDTGAVADIARLRALAPTWNPMDLKQALAETIRWYQGADDAA